MTGLRCDETLWSVEYKKGRYGIVSGREYTYDYKTICAEFDDGVCLLTLDRPDKRNAMNPVLGEEITDALEKLRNDKST